MSRAAAESRFSAAFGYSEHFNFDANRSEVKFNGHCQVPTCLRAGGKQLYIGAFECSWWRRR